MSIIEKYLQYVRSIRRYSQRTVEIYDSVLRDFVLFATEGDTQPSDSDMIDVLKSNIIRGYVVSLLDADPPKKASTVNVHLSCLSAFCKFLIKEGYISSNPVTLVPRPKIGSRLPVFFKKEAMDEYFNHTDHHVSTKELEAFTQDWQTKQGKEAYKKRLAYPQAVFSFIYLLLHRLKWGKRTQSVLPIPPRFGKGVWFCSVRPSKATARCCSKAYTRNRRAWSIRCGNSPFEC